MKCDFREKPKGLPDIWYMFLARELGIYFLGGFHYRWADAEYIGNVLETVNCPPDFVRWLLERMVEEERPETVVVIEKYLAAAGALDEDSGSRFEL